MSRTLVGGATLRDVATRAPDGRPRYGWWPILVVIGLVLAGGLATIAFSMLRSGPGGDDIAEDCPRGGVREVQTLLVEGSAEAEKLTKAADILQQRLSAYDCRGRVGVEGTRVVVAASMEALSHLDELIAPGRLEFREVLDADQVQECPKLPSPAPPEAMTTACSKDGTEQFRLAAAQVTGADVKTARADKDQQLGEWLVLITFTEKGQQGFTRLTRRLVGRRLAIVLDGMVVSAPNINERIDSDAQISGSFTKDTATAFAQLLRSGSLPVTLQRT